MPLVSHVKPRTYQDSVRLMRISETLSALEGVSQAFAAMGTDANKRVLEEVGMLTEAIREAGANDLFVVVEAEAEEAAQQALVEAETLLATTDRRASGDTAAEAAPRSLDQARERLADANLMLLSVPGPYAALEAARALQEGLHVFMFSDNVTLEDERALKELAVSKGLLMMGPGCGTAVINGVALGFANVLQRGAVGVVAASGTGLQELTALVDWGGGGISQAIGVGGRDLSEAVGGLMMRQGIVMLAADPQTEVIVLLSKPPAAGVKASILEAARACGKPIVVNFLGDNTVGIENGLHFTGTLEDTADAALHQVRGGKQACFRTDPAVLDRYADEERRRLGPGQRYVRGLFSGGTLCEEAMEILAADLPGVYSNIPLSPAWALEDGWQSRAHSCIDLGEEEFTRGRPHPMIDLRLRQERLLKEAADPEVAVILFDIVLGYGSHDDPAGALAASIREAKAQAEQGGRYLSVIAHVCGTAQDPQGVHEQERLLREAGAVPLPTNAQAARVAAAIVQR